jgi:hypothetical protein
MGHKAIMRGEAEHFRMRRVSHIVAIYNLSLAPLWFRPTYNDIQSTSPHHYGNGRIDPLNTTTPIFCFALKSLFGS